MLYIRISNHLLHRCSTHQLDCYLQCIPSSVPDMEFDSNAVSVHSRNALQDGNYILSVMKEHSWVQVTSDLHCRKPSWELVCSAWCTRTFHLLRLTSLF